MNGAFPVILSMSLSGSILILALFLCKFFYKNRLSRQWQYYIWLIVIARLLLPFAPQINFMESVFTRIDTDVIQPIQQAYYNGAGESISGFPGQYDAEDAALPTGSQSNSDNAMDMVCAFWLVTALILFVRKITIYQSFIRYVKAGQIPVADPGLLDRLAVIAEESGIRKPIELCSHPLLSSPLLIGFFHPCIVLPNADIPQQDFRYIILHELTHYKRKDMFYKWLVQLTVCLHWFNPLVFMMAREINHACEFSCDEALLAKADTCSAQEYGKTLLNVMGTTGNYKEAVASVTLSENKHLLKERLCSIMGYRKKTIATLCLACTVTLTLFCGAAFLGASGQKAVPSTGGITSAPDNLPVQTLASEGLFLAESPKIDFNVGSRAAVHFMPTSDQEMSISYPDTLYDVSLVNTGGKWDITLSYVGEYSKYPAAAVYIPNLIYGEINIKADDATVIFQEVFQKGKTINANMDTCSVFFHLPEDFTGNVHAIAPDCYLELYSAYKYQNMDITVSNCGSYGTIADGFKKENGKLEYSNGSKSGVISIDFQKGGYLDFGSEPIIPYSE